ncbi:MAG: FAD-dependent oxidoreductase [Actinobacteria bacterium]|nr:FAD-dependent oxidoreductase [Actinomycetota bacterium]
MILTLIEKIQRSSDCFSFLFKPEGPVSWKAGQFMQFILEHENPDDRGTRRFFSISSAPFEANIMITTRFAGEKSSTFKKALAGLEKNDTIAALPPQGEFIVEDFSKSIVFVAGGIGITPVRSIILDLDHKKELSGMQIYLLYSNKNSEILFKDEFDLIASTSSSFKVRYIIDPEKCSIELLKVAVPYFSEKTYYISGPPGMVKAIEEGLLKESISRDNIKLDYFPGY